MESSNISKPASTAPLGTKFDKSKPNLTFPAKFTDVEDNLQDLEKKDLLEEGSSNKRAVGRMSTGEIKKAPVVKRARSSQGSRESFNRIRSFSPPKDDDLPDFDPKKFTPGYVPKTVKKGDVEYLIVMSGVPNTGLCGKYWGDVDSLPSRRRKPTLSPLVTTTKTTAKKKMADTSTTGDMPGGGWKQKPEQVQMEETPQLKRTAMAPEQGRSMSEKIQKIADPTTKSSRMLRNIQDFNNRGKMENQENNREDPGKTRKTLNSQCGTDVGVFRNKNVDSNDQTASNNDKIVEQETVDTNLKAKRLCKGAGATSHRKGKNIPGKTLRLSDLVTCDLMDSDSDASAKSTLDTLIKAPRDFNGPNNPFRSPRNKDGDPTLTGGGDRTPNCASTIKRFLSLSEKESPISSGAASTMATDESPSEMMQSVEMMMDGEEEGGGINNVDEMVDVAGPSRTWQDNQFRKPGVLLADLKIPLNNYFGAQYTSGTSALPANPTGTTALPANLQLLKSQTKTKLDLLSQSGFTITPVGPSKTNSFSSSSEARETTGLPHVVSTRSRGDMTGRAQDGASQDTDESGDTTECANCGPTHQRIRSQGNITVKIEGGDITFNTGGLTTTQIKINGVEMTGPGDDVTNFAIKATRAVRDLVNDN